VNKPFNHRRRNRFHRGPDAVCGSGCKHSDGSSLQVRRYAYAWQNFREMIRAPRRRRGRYQTFLENVKDELVTAGTMFPRCEHVFQKRYVPGIVSNRRFWRINMPDMKCKYCPKLRRSPGNEYRPSMHKRKKKNGYATAAARNFPVFEDSDIRAIREFWATYGGINGVFKYLCLEYNTSQKVISTIINNKRYKSVTGWNE